MHIVKIDLPYLGTVGYTRNLINPADVVEIEESPHITVKYGILNDEPDNIEQILKELHRPIGIRFGATKMFMADDLYNKSDILYIEVFSKEINWLNEFISSSVETVETYKNFYPHLTLAKVHPLTAMQYIGNNPLTGVEITVDTVTYKSEVHERRICVCN